MRRASYAFSISAAAVLSLLASTTAFAQAVEIGRVGAVNPAAAGRRDAGPPRVLLVGNNVTQSERITTDADGRAHLLFIDQSALSVGPNSDIILDRFVFDPSRDAGTLSIRATRGVMRFIGGRISKAGDVTISTPAGTAGIRGGMSIIQAFDDQSALFVHLYGDYTRIAPRVACAQQRITIARRNFAVRLPHQCNPAPIPEDELATLLLNFRGTLPTTPEALNQLSTAAGGAAIPDLNFGNAPSPPPLPPVFRPDTRFWDQTPAPVTQTTVSPPPLGAPPPPPPAAAPPPPAPPPPVPPPLAPPPPGGGGGLAPPPRQ
jgi:hypothetical protein